jgi:transposase
VPAKYDKETKAKAVRLVVDHVEDYASEWEAIKTVASRLGMTTETLRRWVRQAEVDNGDRPGVSSAERAEIRELKRRNRELEQTVEILKAAAGFFARESDPRLR